MSDPTDRGVSMRGRPRAELQRTLALLTKLAEAYPPAQGTEQAQTSRLQTYMEAIGPHRWHPDTLAKAIKSGLLKWKFFPSIAELETECLRYEPPSQIVESRLYRPLNGPNAKSLPPPSGPGPAAFASLREALKTGTTGELLAKLKSPSS